MLTAQWVDAVLAIALRASVAIRNCETKARGAMQLKSDQSPLTAADLASHQIVTEGLAQLTPELPVLSEESAGIDFELRRHWQRYWLVDPLDGTREFIAGNGEYTVNIALIDAGRPVLGVVTLPAQQRYYVGGVGVPARCDSKLIRAQVRRGERWQVLASRSHGAPQLAGFLARLGPHELSVSGSALKFCRLAEGSADLYPRFGPTSEWDTAAGQAVLEAAGGAVLTQELTPLSYNQRASTLNPDFIACGAGPRDWTSAWIR
jgi:3'(2'), 5'-bisphosphate nucleotidase